MRVGRDGRAAYVGNGADEHLSMSSVVGAVFHAQRKQRLADFALDQPERHSSTGLRTPAALSTGGTIES